jgi:hypothetical protein
LALALADLTADEVAAIDVAGAKGPPLHFLFLHLRVFDWKLRVRVAAAVVLVLLSLGYYFAFATGVRCYTY